MNHRAAQQRGIEYSDDEGSQQAAGNEPPGIQISPKSSRASLLALSDRFFIPSGRLRGSMARGRYRRQREYPQPPPPSKSTTKITINRVSIVSPLFGLSIHQSHSTPTRRDCCPILDVLENNYPALLELRLEHGSYLMSGYWGAENLWSAFLERRMLGGRKGDRLRCPGFHGQLIKPQRCHIALRAS